MRSVRSPQSTLGYVIGMQFKGFVIVTAEDDRRVNYSLNRTLCRETAAWLTPVGGE